MKINHALTLGLIGGFAAVAAIAANPIKNLVFQGDVDAAENQIKNLGNPTASGNAATKGWVESYAATAAQGGKADTAVQPEDLADIATSGDWSDLQGTPTTLAGYGIANGALNTDARFPTSDQKAALAGTSGTPSNGNRYVTDADSRLTNARTPTAHTHTLSQITDAGTAAAQPVSAFATAAQGALAATAVQPGDVLPLPGDTLSGLSVIYNDAIGDKFGMEQVGVPNGLASAYLRLFTSGIGNAQIALGYYSDPTTFVPWMVLGPGGHAIHGNVSVTGDFAVSGDSTMGDSALDTHRINAGTFEAPNATHRGATRVANNGTLQGIRADEFLSGCQYVVPTMPVAWRSFVSGSGIFRTQDQALQTLLLRTDPTAATVVITTRGASLTGNYGQFIYPGDDVRGLNFARRHRLSIWLSEISATSTSSNVSYFAYGQDASVSSTPRPLAVAGLGFKIESGEIFGQVHDGSSLTTTASLGTIPNRTVGVLLIDSSGSGSVTFQWMANSPVTTTGGPAAQLTSNNYNIEIGTTNGAGTPLYQLSISSIRVLVGP